MPPPGTSFATITLTGATCRLNEVSANVTGAVSGQSPNARGTLTFGERSVFAVAPVKNWAVWRPSFSVDVLTVGLSCGLIAWSCGLVSA